MKLPTYYFAYTFPPLANRHFAPSWVYYAKETNKLYPLGCNPR